MSEHWSDLPDDLLHLVYNKVTGLRHRVCFAAVCTQWRATAITARHEAPPTLPWLVFSTSHDNDCKTRRAYCPEDGGVMRIPLPSALIGKRVVGAHDDGWVAALGDNMQLVVVNLFSGAEVPLPAKDLRTVCSDRRSNVIWKVVFSESPTSSGCILAAITPEYGIALCRLGFPDSSWMSLSTRCGPSFMDITFCSGQLYGKFCYQNIVKFEIGVNKDGGLVITGEPQRLHIRWHSSDMLEYPNNIVELHGKLAMVGRTWSHGIRRGFKVFELVDETSTEYDYKWEEVTSLGDYALFLGTMWSKVVYMPAAGRGRVQTNCIYADDATYLTSLDGHGDPVYPMLDKSNDDVTQWIKTAGCNVAVQSSTGTWVLPPDF